MRCEEEEEERGAHNHRRGTHQKCETHLVVAQLLLLGVELRLRRPAAWERH
jgi:hypothetical protein